jgi:hypothetical protein
MSIERVGQDYSVVDANDTITHLRLFVASPHITPRTGVTYRANSILPNVFNAF